MMNIEEFLLNNPTFSECDVDSMKIDGKHDEKALKAFHDNINRPDKVALRGVYSPILTPSHRPMFQSPKQSSLSQRAFSL